MTVSIRASSGVYLTARDLHRTGLRDAVMGGVLVLIAYFAAAFGYRIHVEEPVLTSRLGEYVAAKRTKRLIPYVL